MSTEKTGASAALRRVAMRRLRDRIESRKHDAAQFLVKMTEYIESEEWDLARGLCHIGASCLESLRDDTNRLADLDG